MKCFKMADLDDDRGGELSERVCYLKREEGDVDIMCEVSERIMERGRKIGEERKARSTTLNLSRMGRSLRTDEGADFGYRSLYLFMRYSDLFCIQYEGFRYDLDADPDAQSSIVYRGPLLQGRIWGIIINRKLCPVRRNENDSR